MTPDTQHEQDPIAALRQRLEKTEREAHQLRQALKILDGGVIVAGDTTYQTNEYEGLGIVDAAKRFIAEKGGTPRTTSEIRDALMSRGWQTKSKNAVATIYATLENSKAFIRTKDGRWDPKEPRKQGSGA
jgi:hypothetical protein